MDITEVKWNLGRTVIRRTEKQTAKYKLTGCIIRKGKNGFFYQAELQDLNERSIVICKLSEITTRT